MNLLYITHLTGRLSDGPCYSVPAQIKSQSKYDDVFWWNLTLPILPHWKETGLFHNIEQYPKKSISSLPAPFNMPDLVVFEDFYYIDDIILSFECRRRHIPYVITPRGALTKQGQSKKCIKKKIANLLAFRPMVKHAAAIQYLTEQEYKDSGEQWNSHCFIEPNGIYPVTEEKKWGEKNQFAAIHGVYIGRFDLYHKGLDILYNAVLKMQNQMRKFNITIALYGPECDGQREKLKRNIIENEISDILCVNDSVFDDNKKTVLENADFFIMTSRFEGMPMSMIEAMSYGLPCVASKGTNLSDVIKANNAGWVCENNVNSVVRALTKLIRQRSNIFMYGNNAWKLSMHYDWDRIANRTHQQYKRIMKRIAKQ